MDKRQIILSNSESLLDAKDGQFCFEIGKNTVVVAGVLSPLLEVSKTEFYDHMEAKCTQTRSL